MTLIGSWLVLSLVLTLSYVILRNLPPKPPVRRVREPGMVQCANCGAHRPLSDMMRMMDRRASWELYGNLVCRVRCDSDDSAA